MVAPGVGDEEESGLPEGSLDLIGEGSRGEAASDGRAADVPGKNRIYISGYCNHLFGNRARHSVAAIHQHYQLFA